MTLTGPVFFLQIARAPHDTKIGCIRLLWAEAKKHKLSFLLCAGPFKHDRLISKLMKRLGIEIKRSITNLFSYNLKSGGSLPLQKG